MLVRNLPSLVIAVAVADVSAAAENMPTIKPIRIVLVGDSMRRTEE